MNRKILALAIPNIISNITVPLVGHGRYGHRRSPGVDSLIGAMAIGVAIFNFIYWNSAFLLHGNQRARGAGPTVRAIFAKWARCSSVR